MSSRPPSLPPSRGCASRTPARSPRDRGCRMRRQVTARADHRPAGALPACPSPRQARPDRGCPIRTTMETPDHHLRPATSPDAAGENSRGPSPLRAGLRDGRAPLDRRPRTLKFWDDLGSTSRSASSARDRRTVSARLGEGLERVAAAVQRQRWTTTARHSARRIRQRDHQQH